MKIREFLVEVSGIKCLHCGERISVDSSFERNRLVGFYLECPECDKVDIYLTHEAIKDMAIESLCLSIFPKGKEPVYLESIKDIIEQPKKKATKRCKMLKKCGIKDVSVWRTCSQNKGVICAHWKELLGTNN